MQPHRRPWGCQFTRQVLNLLGLVRRPQVEEIRIGYARGGLSVWGQPIPWNAEAALIDLWVWLPRCGDWPREDYRICLPYTSPLWAVTVERSQPDLARVSFRLPPLQQTTEVTLWWRSQPLDRVVLPFLSEQEFLDELRLEEPTCIARLGNHLVPCRGVIAGQPQALLAGGLLTSPTSLLPLAGHPVTLEFRRGDTVLTHHLTPVLPRPEMAPGQVFLLSPLSSWPHQEGEWVVRWSVLGRTLARAPFRVVAAQKFLQSLSLVDRCYRWEAADGTATFHPCHATRENLRNPTPCFRIASTEPGVAGLCTFQVVTRPSNTALPPQTWHVEALVTDLPAPIVPPVPSSPEYRQARSFELLCGTRSLGLLPANACLPVAFTAEGGFQVSADFDWTPAAEQELAERLGRLMTTSEEWETDELIFLR